MAQPALHVQNVYDVLNPQGTGVNGYLKLKCLQVQNRVVALANSGDIVAVSGDCAQSFIDYMNRIKNVSGVMAVRYGVSRDMRKFINSRTVFEGLVRDPQWGAVLKRHPVLRPYMQSASVAEVAKEKGIHVSEAAWRAAVDERLPETMNDKAVFYRECDALGVPIPRFWICTCDTLIGRTIELLREGHNPLYVRQAKSAGAFGNITVDEAGGRYSVRELGIYNLRLNEFIRAVDEFMRTSYCDEYVIAELLDLHASPGTLFYADDERVASICHTHQVMNQQRRHVGFMYPILDEAVRMHFETIESALYRILEPWRRLGYRGYGNIDWMVTKDGGVFLAELNARQTAVIPGLTIENRLTEPGEERTVVTAPTRSIVTRELIYFEERITFDGLYKRLQGAGLLWEQQKEDGGVVVTNPPSPAFGINSAGLMAIADELPAARALYGRALESLGVRETDLLFG